MNNIIKFKLNNIIIEYTGNPSGRLLDVLRNELNLTGTKCGCKEGECGACAVIINGKLYNSSLVSMGWLNGTDVMTIEGYSKTSRFTVLDEAYEAVSAVQCGFCIPGMVMASEALLSQNPKPTEDDIRTGISGNLCRCTGYNSIVSAIKSASEKYRNDSSDAQNDKSLTLAQALELRKNPNLTVYAGGTDIMVNPKEDAEYLYIHNIPELKQIVKDNEYIRFGAACTFTEVIEHSLTPEILRDACRQIAAPAVRNAGTIGGNIANGSAKADSALIFMLTDSELCLKSAGNERIIPVRDFYPGKKKTAIQPDELIVEILMPRRNYDNYYYKKVGPRKALAISRTSFAGVIDIQSNIIQHTAVAFGAVSDVIIRFPGIDSMLTGKTVEEAKKIKNEYLSAYNKAIIPVKGRVGIKYRKQVCMNLLRDFLESNGI